METLTVVDWPIANLRACTKQRKSDEAVVRVVRLIEKHGFEVPVLIDKSAETLLMMLARTEIIPLPTTMASI